MPDGPDITIGAQDFGESDDPRRDLRPGARRTPAIPSRSRRSAGSVTSCSPRSNPATSTSRPSTPRRRSSSSTARPARPRATSTRRSSCSRPSSNRSGSTAFDAVARGRLQLVRRHGGDRRGTRPRERQRPHRRPHARRSSGLPRATPSASPACSRCTTSTCRPTSSRSTAAVRSPSPPSTRARSTSPSCSRPTARIADKGWVVLKDDKGLINADNIVPVGDRRNSSSLRRRACRPDRRDQRGARPPRRSPSSTGSSTSNSRTPTRSPRLAEVRGLRQLTSSRRSCIGAWHRCTTCARFSAGEAEQPLAGVVAQRGHVVATLLEHHRRAGQLGDQRALPVEPVGGDGEVARSGRRGRCRDRATRSPVLGSNASIASQAHRQRGDVRVVVGVRGERHVEVRPAPPCRRRVRRRTR